jgi:hypothetical protein
MWVRSDGNSCANCSTNLGNSRDSNTDKYWRSIASFPVGQLAGSTVLDAAIGAALVSGTGNLDGQRWHRPAWAHALRKAAVNCIAVVPYVLYFRRRRVLRGRR